MSYGFLRKISDGLICVWDARKLAFGVAADRTYGKLSSHLIGSDQRENIPSWTFLGTAPAKTETLNAALFTGLRFEFRAQIILMLLAYQIWQKF